MKGKLTILIGESGSGKSAYLKTLGNYPYPSEYTCFGDMTMQKRLKNYERHLKQCDDSPILLEEIFVSDELVIDIVLEIINIVSDGKDVVMICSNEMIYRRIFNEIDDDIDIKDIKVLFFDNSKYRELSKDEMFSYNKMRMFLNLDQFKKKSKKEV